jgi:putative ATP-binding cassette transporter
VPHRDRRAHSPGARSRRPKLPAASTPDAAAAVSAEPIFKFQPPAVSYEGDSAVHESFALLRELWRGAFRVPSAVLFAGIVVVLVGNMMGQIELNDWNGSFFDIIAKRELAALGHQLLIFLGIIGFLLSLVVAQTWMLQMLKIRLREWLTKYLLDKWLTRGRAYRLALAGELGVNPDQRIEEDSRKLTDLSAGLAVGFLQASMLLISFIGILWSLSRQLVFVVAGHHFSVPGYMVWCALAYALIGSFLTWRVGRPLVGLNAQLYAREAELRFALVRVSESAESIALFHGERDELRQLGGNVDRVIGTMQQLTGALSRLTWITSGYGWLAIIVPILVASPGFFSGSLSLGGLMVVVGAFNQVQGSLRWFVDQFPSIADWRATLHRISAFKYAMDKLDETDRTVEHIQIVPHPDGTLAFDGLSVLFADGRAVIAEATAEIGLGERVLIVGESGAGKSTLFRAVAGLWPWGAGRILVPDAARMMFMPQRPYLPLGTLRAALAYPDAPSSFAEPEFERVLKRVGLADLVPMLDVAARFDKSLSLGEQQLVGFARLLLHAPRWIFLDEATSALDELSQRRVMSIFEDELADATVVSIGHRPGLEEFHTRVLHLVRGTAGALLQQHPAHVPWPRAAEQTA